MTSPPRRSRLGRALIWAGVAGLALVLLLVAAVAMLQTSAGKRWLAAELSALASGAAGYDIAIGEIDGVVPVDFSIAALRVADADGVWLVAENLHLAWSPAELLGGRVSISRLAADRIEVHRSPVTEEPVAPSEPGLPSLELPSLPVEIQLADLEIATLRLGEPLVGAEITAAAFGSLSLGGAPNEAAAALDVMRLDGAPGEVRIRLAQSGERELQLEATVREPAGGLVVRLLDLPGLPAIDLRLSGSGPATGWSGRLDARAGDAAIGLDVQLALDEALRLGLAGTVDTGGLAGPELRELLPRPLTLDAALGWAPGGELDVDRLALSARGLALTLAGAIDSSGETVSAEAELAVNDSALLARLADPARAEALHATARVSGRLEAPQIALDAAVDRLAAPGVQAEAVSVLLSVQPADDQTRQALSLQVMPSGLTLEASAPLSSIIGPAPEITLDGTLDPASGDLDIARLTARGAALELTGQGRVAEAGRDVDAALRLTLADLAPLGELAQQPLGGGLVVELRATGDATLPALAVDLAARASDLALGDQLMSGLVGTAPQLVGALTVEGDTLRIDRAELTTAAIAATVSGSVAENIDLQLTASAADLRTVARQVGADLAGALALEAHVAGALDNPAVDGRISGNGVVATGIPLGNAVIDLSAADLATGPRGTLAFTAAPGGAALEGRTAFQVTPQGGIRVSGLQIAGAGDLALRGDLALGANGLLDGSLRGEIADLSPWQGLAGTPLAGAVSLQLQAVPRNGQQIVLALTGRALAVAEAVTIATLQLDAEIANALGDPAIEARLAATKVAAEPVAFDEVVAAARGRLAGLDWTLDATNAAAEDPTLHAQGRLGLAGSGGTVTLAALDAALPPVTLALARPATLGWDDRGVHFDDIEAAIGDGRLVASGSFAAGDLALAANLTDLPLGLLAELAGGLALDGRLSATAALTGTPAAPEGRITMAIAELREAGVDPAEAVALAAEGEARLAGGRVDATARLTGPADFNLDARVSAPMGGSGALDGTVRGVIDLALVPSLVDLRGDALAGRLDLDLALGGSLDVPQASGRATLRDGAYESASAGTVLRNLAAEVVGGNRQLRLASLSADDGNGGRLSGTAALAIDAAAGFPLTASVTLDRFTALRRSDATVQASGKVDISRAAAGGRISGSLTVDSAELRIPERLGGSIVTLEVTEINQPPDQSPRPEPDTTPGAPLDLAVTVDVPGRAFLRGRGLDSEWRGRLAVGGTTAEPDITGTLDVVRGTLDLLGRIFRFDQGQVGFVGGGEIDPELAFTARSEAETLTVVAVVSGTASNPSFALTSEPPLPQDEILARLLFGTSAGSLTPLQAVQLAQTAAQLSGAGGPVSILDELRQGFGLDVLGIEGGESPSASSLTVGKYLTDDVFLRMNQGLTPESRRVGVEVRVLPRVTVESDIGAQSQGSVGVNWRYDY